MKIRHTFLLISFFMSQMLIFAQDFRVISLAPSITEILFAVGSGDQLVANTTYCDYPEEAKSLPKIGGYYSKSISIESIVGFQPDLIIGEINTHGSLQAEFDKLGLMYIFINSVSYDDLFANIQLIGDKTGNSEKAGILVDNLKSRRDRLVSVLSDISHKKTVYWEIWHDPFMSVGSKTFIGQSITLAKGKNIFDDAETDWPQISVESLIAADPDIIISSNSHGGKITVEDMKKRQAWEGLSAVLNDKVYMLEENLLSRPGPRIIDGLEQIAQILYPEKF